MLSNRNVVSVVTSEKVLLLGLYVVSMWCVICVNHLKVPFC